MPRMYPAQACADKIQARPLAPYANSSERGLQQTRPTYLDDRTLTFCVILECENASWRNLVISTTHANLGEFCEGPSRACALLKQIIFSAYI